MPKNILSISIKTPGPVVQQEGTTAVEINHGMSPSPLALAGLVQSREIEHTGAACLTTLLHATYVRSTVQLQSKVETAGGSTKILECNTLCWREGKKNTSTSTSENTAQHFTTRTLVHSSCCSCFCGGCLCRHAIQNRS